MKNVAFIFPGQGSQSIGMGKELADAFPLAKYTFQEIDDSLNQKLSQMMFAGAPEDLNLTENTQPALMAASLAVTRVLEEQGGFKLAEKARYVAGHSLGEYSAHAAVKTFGLPDTARLLKIRGSAMQKAVPVGIGAMAAFLGIDFAEAEAIALEAAQGQVCSAANDNAPGQVVLSGHKEAIERAIEIGKARGVKKAVLLPVSAPFHCALMQPAADAMETALSKTNIQPPTVPVVTNISVQPEIESDRIRDLLVEQVTGTVRWRESILWMAGQGIDTMIELGTGKVLAGLVKRIAPDVKTMSVSTPQDVEELLKASII